MKYLGVLILIPLFLFAEEKAKSFDVLSTVSESSDYGRSTLYSYLLEPFIVLDEKWDSVVSHCSILDKDLQTIQIYKGMGSCLFDQVDVLSNEEEVEKNIIFHVTLEGQSFDLLFQWEGFSLQEVFSSYMDEEPHRLSSRISFRLINSGLSLSDFLLALISSEIWTAQTAQEAHLVRKVLSIFLKKNISAVRLALTPYSAGLMKAELSFLDSADNVFYRLAVITNYYVGADEYFLTSMDRYQK